MAILEERPYKLNMGIVTQTLYKLWLFYPVGRTKCSERVNLNLEIIYNLYAFLLYVIHLDVGRDRTRSIIKTPTALVALSLGLDLKSTLAKTLSNAMLKLVVK